MMGERRVVQEPLFYGPKADGPFTVCQFSGAYAARRNLR